MCIVFVLVLYTFNLFSFFIFYIRLYANLVQLSKNLRFFLSNIHKNARFLCIFYVKNNHQNMRKNCAKNKQKILPKKNTSVEY